MTVQYEGGDLYSVMLGNRTFFLRKNEIDEIQSYNFDTGEEIKSIEDLQMELEEHKYIKGELNSTYDEIDELCEEVDSILVESKEDNMYDLKSKIVDISYKLQKMVAKR